MLGNDAFDNLDSWKPDFNVQVFWYPKLLPIKNRKIIFLGTSADGIKLKLVSHHLFPSDSEALQALTREKKKKKNQQSILSPISSQFCTQVEYQTASKLSLVRSRHVRLEKKIPAVGHIILIPCLYIWDSFHLEHSLPSSCPPSSCPVFKNSPP